MSESTVLEQPKSTSIIESIVFPVALAEIATLKTEVMALKIKGIDDEDGALAVKKARLRCRDTRILIDKKREALKADSIAYGKKVQSVAGVLQDALAPAEQHCKDEEARIEKLREAIVQKQQDELYALRSKRWSEVGGPLATREYILSFDEDGFNARLTEVKEESERQRVAAQKAADEAEELKRKNDQLEAERERERLQRKITSDRLRSMASVGVFPDMDYISGLTDSEFDVQFTQAKTAFDDKKQQEDSDRKRLKALQDAADEAERQKREEESKKAAEVAPVAIHNEPEKVEVLTPQKTFGFGDPSPVNTTRRDYIAKLATLCDSVREIKIPFVGVKQTQELTDARGDFISAIERIATEL